jgi:excisionase family DNA binding protein
MVASTKTGSKRRRSGEEHKVLPWLLTIPEVAIALGLGRTKVYELIAFDGLPVIKLGGATRVSAASLQKWIEQREKLSMSA